MPVDGLGVGIERMRRAGAEPYAIASFARSYERLRRGDHGWLPERELEPLDAIPDLDDVTADPGDPALLARVAVVRLNGGLGTTMATRAGKGSLEVKAGLSFVGLAVGQVAALRRRSGCALPLLFMTSAVSAGPDGASGSGPSRGSGGFQQCVMPRLGVDDLHPIDWPRDRRLEWAPAGHGDVFPALASSGRLRELLDAGFEHACISSVDNVAATVDGRIVAAMQRDDVPFLMEVADRTTADRKGGHLARRRGGGLVLRDLAQTPPGETDAFQDVTRHRFFNTNTIWVDLRALDARLAAQDLLLDLPLISNRKVVDPYDPGSPEVIQVESAMGAGISVFPGAAVRRVERTGFNPVKSTAELLAVRSDAYVLTDEHRLALDPVRDGAPPVIELDPVHFGRQVDFDDRFPAGAPSLVGCERLEVRGDVSFGADVVVRGSVCIDHSGSERRRIPSGSVLEG